MLPCLPGAIASTAIRMVVVGEALTESGDDFLSAGPWQLAFDTMLPAGSPTPST